MGVEVTRPPAVRRLNALRYAAGVRIPWSRGYGDFKTRYVTGVLADAGLMGRFRSAGPLPAGYGVGLDERCVEWPWFFSRAAESARNYLDAGAALNHAHVLHQPYWGGRRLTIVTLAPEAQCFWRLGVSYQYADLRALPFRDGWFDEIACLSTLEHVGMDNSFYASTEAAKLGMARDFEVALVELRRVLKRGGRLLLSVPFGCYQNLRAFQQFDAGLLDRAAEVFESARREDTFYRYGRGGWQRAARDECAEDEFSAYMVSRWIPGLPPRPPEADGAAAARAVACCVWARG